MVTVVECQLVENHFVENHRFEGFAESRPTNRSKNLSDSSVQNSIVLPSFHSGREKI